MPRRKSLSFVKPQVIQVIGGAGFMSPMNSPPPVVLDTLSTTLNVFNANPYLIGIFYLFLNLGGRFLSLELTKRQEWFLSQSYVRPFILFAVMFISTRNIAVAFWTTLGILSVLWVFANENSEFCLVPGWKQNPVPPINNYDDVMNRIKNLMKSDDTHADDGHHEPPEVPKPVINMNDEAKPEHNDPKPEPNEPKPEPNDLNPEANEPKHNHHQGQNSEN
jgi:hypothetical protein